MTLTEILNAHIGPLFQEYTGVIPEIVPAITEDGRRFAGGNTVLRERLRALISGNKERIDAWGNTPFDLADVILTFEDLIKFQLDSPFLTAIRGVVDTVDGFCIAVDAKAVSSVVYSMEHFLPVRESETAIYMRNEEFQQHKATNVVLLSYGIFTPDQFKAVKAPEINRKKIMYGADMERRQIVMDGKVRHPIWANYDSGIIVPLVEGGTDDKGKKFEGVFEHNYRVRDCSLNMGVFLAPKPSKTAEMRALFISGPDGRSGLYARSELGRFSRLIGEYESAKGALQDLESPYKTATEAMIRGDPVIRTPQGDYVLTKERLSK